MKGGAKFSFDAFALINSKKQKMRLSEKEYYQYIDLHPRLIYFVGQKKGFITATVSLEEFLEDNTWLYPFYYKEWGRINSRAKKKELKLMGVKNYHFAICEDVIVTSGKSPTEVKKNVQKMISSKDILDSIFYFKV